MNMRFNDALVQRTFHEGVLIITLNDPARRNPISTAMREELIAVLEAAAADDAVRVLVLTGAGGAFSSGGDLAAMPPASREDGDARMARVRILVQLVSESAKPTIAAIEGPAAGISVGLAAACDIVVMAEDAKLLFPFTRLGLLPDGGLLGSLSQRVGRSAAKRILLLGNPVGSAVALSSGFADELTPRGGALSRAVEAATELSARAPRSLAAVKKFFAAGELEIHDALATEQRIQPDMYFSQNFAEGKAAFFERREPQFNGN